MEKPTEKPLKCLCIPVASHISPLYTKLYLLKVLFRLVTPFFTCISTSARNWPCKLEPQLASDVLCRFMTLTTPTHYWAFSSQGPLTRECYSGLKLPKMQEMESLQGERSIFYAHWWKEANKLPILYETMFMAQWRLISPKLLHSASKAYCSVEAYVMLFSPSRQS